MICMDPDPAYAWCHPKISHLTYDNPMWLRRVIQWANDIARGKDDQRQVAYPAKFVQGGTIGPAKDVT